MMNRYLVSASAVAIASAGSAFAQGYNGSYVGVELGWGTSAVDFCISCVGSNSDWADDRDRDFSLDGAVAGIYGGRNFAISDTMMWGVEAAVAFNAASWEGDVDDVNAVFDGYEASADWLASLRGRFGLIQGPTLYYATAGVAATRLKLDNPDCSDCSATGTTEFLDATHWGGVVGLGVEHQLSNGLSVRGQALYYNFGSAETEAPDPGIDYADNEASLRSTTLSVGLSYQF